MPFPFLALIPFLNVLGVPLGTFLRQAFGWRSTFWAVTLIGVLAFVEIATLVPRIVGREARTCFREELSSFARVRYGHP